MKAAESATNLLTFLPVILESYSTSLKNSFLSD